MLTSHRLLLCGGSGGVGKTTSAAALGLVAARAGVRTLVLTIDPARRLADAMGLSRIDHTPTPVAQVPNLSVMMLDAAQSIDELVGQHAPDARAREALLGNAYYRQIAASVAGSREFVAMEKLHDLLDDERYELLIVDTPPAQQALDFLDAPKRLLALLDGSGLGLLLRGTSLANRFSFGLLGQGQKQFAKLFEHLTGHRLLVDLNNFYASFEPVLSGFRTRARLMQSRLRSDDTGFVLVLTPAADAVAAADQYLQRLRAESMNLLCLLFNQVLPVEALSVPISRASEGLQAAGLPLEQVEAVLSTYNGWQARATDQSTLMHRWHSASGIPYLSVPRFGQTVGSLADLEQFAASLTTGPQSSH